MFGFSTPLFLATPLPPNQPRLLKLLIAVHASQKIVSDSLTRMQQILSYRLRISRYSVHNLLYFEIQSLGVFIRNADIGILMSRSFLVVGCALEGRILIEFGIEFLKCKPLDPCHHGMARPQVADGGEGLQIWRVAANIYWIISRGQPTRGGRPAWGLGGVLTTPHRKKKETCYEMSQRASERWI
jgi:hypothetical protein